MFDTHCHLNFKAFSGKVADVIGDAKKEGVSLMVIPGTDVESSKKAIEIAGKFEGIYAAVGIHPHHVFEMSQSAKTGLLSADLAEIDKLVRDNKVVAIGEVGMDRHYYNKTKYPGYKVDELFIELQGKFLSAQIKLAIKYDKSIIFHNREAKKDFLKIVSINWDKKLEGRAVFHCCEPDKELLDFAKDRKIYLGVDGDITYRKDKQEFIKIIPLMMLVLETDAPFLLPIQLRGDSKKKPANEPKNLRFMANFISEKIGLNTDELESTTEENSKKLFQLI